MDCVSGKYFGATAATSATTCVDCEPGKYSDVEKYRVSTCWNCGRGKYSGATGATACVACVLFYNVDGNMLPLGPEMFSGEGYDKCYSSCQPGTYHSDQVIWNLRDPECLDCTPGNYSGTTGANACDYYCSSDTLSKNMATTCRNCGAGTYGMKYYREWECKRCEEGMYSAGSGATSATACRKCDSGKYSNVSGSTSSTSCRNCVKGKNSQSGASTCRRNCDAGTYSELDKASNCDYCGEGSTPGRQERPV